MKQIVKVPQHIVDEHALIAQKYAGCLVGHPVRAARYTVPLPGSVDIDFTRPWVEPNPVQDACLFCRRLTDEEAERRVFGFQAAIDKEVLARKWTHLQAWISTAPEEQIPTVIYLDQPGSVAMPDGTTKLVRQRNIGAMTGDFRNRRKFIEENQYRSRGPGTSLSGAPRPSGWNTKAANIVSLPLRVKRKMCIEWNHVYLDWMRENGLEYDFEAHEFYRQIDALDDWNVWAGT